VEIIGWLYQFYISEKKDEVFAALKKNVKISKENIPAATQLFTPHWIVRFMVENSLGRLWLLNHPESRLKERMKYFVESDPEPDYLKVKDPTEIKCLDPCCGSGHILAYFFELLYAIYEEEGYAPQEIPSLIVKHNIFGIDIDERAAELAAFTLAMVAREKDKRFFERGVVPNMIAMRDIDVDLRKLNIRLSPALQESLELLKEGRNYGSLIPAPLGAGEEISEVEATLKSHRYDDLFRSAERDDIGIAFRILKYLEPHYHVVVTNPPYMDTSNANAELKTFVLKNYPDSKSDLFAVFIERCLSATLSNGFIGMINQHGWMFLSSFRDLRKKIIEQDTILTLLHLGARAFESIGGEVVQSSTFILRKGYLPTAKGVYIKLNELPSTRKKELVTLEAIKDRNNELVSIIHQNDFKDINGSPIAYWIRKKYLDSYKIKKTIKDIAEVRLGMCTGNNEKYIRFWTEVSFLKIGLFSSSYVKFEESRKVYVPHNKGGEPRKWYGNIDYVLKFDKTAYGELSNSCNKLASRSRYFIPCCSYSEISTSYFFTKYVTAGFVFNIKSPSIFPIQGKMLFTISLLNSKPFSEFLSLISSTISINGGDVQVVPCPNIPSNFVIIDIEKRAKRMLAAAKSDWDLHENSWDFHGSPLITDYFATPIDTVIDENLTDRTWPSIFKPGVAIDLEAQKESFMSHWTQLFVELHRNEEENNRIFIDLYELQDELTAEVPYSEITILQDELLESARKENRIEFDESILARQFVSYGVGCLMGRYSVDTDGLILADAGSTLDDFMRKVPNASFLPDEDAILPLTDEDDFSDDLPTRFKAWLRVISGKYFEDNLRWIEDRLGKDLRSYFIRDFYKDHLRRYKNRPIYWMISSPSGSFRTLMYLHRYTKDTVGKVLNDYLRPYQNKTEYKLRGLQGIMYSSSDSQSDKVKAKKRTAQLEKISAELDLWEKDVVYPTALARIELDLDDGVKVNYRKLSAILEPVKQLEAKEEE